MFYKYTACWEMHLENVQIEQKAKCVLNKVSLKKALLERPAILTGLLGETLQFQLLSSEPCLEYADKIWG